MIIFLVIVLTERKFSNMQITNREHFYGNMSGVLRRSSFGERHRGKRFMALHQSYLIRKNKTSLYLTRKIPGSVRLGLIQPYFQELSQETWGKMFDGACFLTVLASLSQLDLICFLA